MRFPPEMGQQCHVSRRVVQGISGFSSNLFHKAFPRGFSTGLSHVPTQCESILGLKVEAVQGNQVSLEWPETSGGLLEWWHDPGVSLTFPVQSTSSCDAAGKWGILSRRSRETIPHLKLLGRNGASLYMGGTLELPLEWRRVCRETS